MYRGIDAWVGAKISRGSTYRYYYILYNIYIYRIHINLSTSHACALPEHVFCTLLVLQDESIHAMEDSDDKGSQAALHFIMLKSAYPSSLKP